MSDKIVMGMATCIERAEYVEDVVKSLIDQVDELWIVFDGYQRIPDWVHKYMAIMPVLDESRKRRERGKFIRMNVVNRYYLTVDDDIIYPHDYVDRLIKKSKEWGDAVVVCVHGVDIEHPFVDYYKSRATYRMAEELLWERVVDIAGTGTVCFHTKAVDVSVKEFEWDGMSDIWFSGLLKERGVKRVCIEREKGWLKPLYLEGIYEKVQKDKQLLAKQTELVKRFFPD